MAPVLEVADVFRRHGKAFRQARAGHLGRVERRVVGAITAWRTALLGGHVEQCDDCGTTRIAYNSCRNRHCRKCQGLARAEWLAHRQAELLPVPYFHVVFTLPTLAGEIAFQTKAAVYAMQFRAAAETLTAADPRHLGAQIGVTAVSIPGAGPCSTIHTFVAWCQMAAPRSTARAGSLAAPASSAGTRALAPVSSTVPPEPPGGIRCRRTAFFGNLAGMAEPTAFAAGLDQLRRIEWVVYAKPPFGRPAQVLDYFGRYTHRVAITAG